MAQYNIGKESCCAYCGKPQRLWPEDKLHVCPESPLGRSQTKNIRMRVELNKHLGNV